MDIAVGVGDGFSRSTYLGKLERERGGGVGFEKELGGDGGGGLEVGGIEGVGEKGGEN